jgi:hypothetical protein
VICRVSLLKNGRETVSVGEEEEVGEGNSDKRNKANYVGSSIILQLEKVKDLVKEQKKKHKNVLFS